MKRIAPSAESPFAPRQARSRATADRLLLATLQVLEEKGLDAAVIPAIAAAARVAPASVYRRFADKDDLLRSAFLKLLRQSHQNNSEHAKDKFLRDSLPKTARRVVQLWFEQYRQHPGLFRALVRFLETDSNAEFVHEARSILRSNIEIIVDVMLVHRPEFASRISRRDVRFAVFNCGCSVYTYMLDPHSLWHTEPQITEAELSRLLTRNLLAFLGREHRDRLPLRKAS
jgi:AcrR family transcriptional regulator